MDSSGLIVVVITVSVTVLGIAGLVIKGKWDTWQTAKRMRALPRTRIRDLVEGQRVRIVGTARSVGELTAGVFSGEPCLATSAASVASGRNAQDLPQPDDRSVAFRLEDESGAIDVDAVGATLSIANSHTVDLGASGAFGAGIIAREGGSGGRRVRYYESRLAADDQVAVLGTVTREANGTLRITRPVELSTYANAFVA